MANQQMNPVVKSRSANKNRSSRSTPMSTQASGPSDITLPMRRCEILTSISLNAGTKEGSGYQTFSMADGGKHTPVLLKLARPFEMYKITSMSLVFKTASASTRSGQVVIGVDYNSKTAINPITKPSVLAMQSIVFPCYEKEVRIRLSLDSLPRFRQPQDARDTPFAVYWYASSSDASAYIGDIYLDYNIILYGINAA